MHGPRRSESLSFDGEENGEDDSDASEDKDEGVKEISRSSKEQLISDEEGLKGR